MAYNKKKKGAPTPPQPGWAVYLRTSSDENQKPELSRARQRFAIEENVLKRSNLPLIGEYVDVLTGKTPNREGYQRLLADARAGKFSHVIVERADRFGRDDTEALRAIDELNDFGVAVRFANSPDLDPMDPDGRVIVALSFTLARRETALLGIRVKGGLRAKRENGGFSGQAPDGYCNVQERTTLDAKKQFGRFTRHIELDPERVPVIREAWDLLLEDKLTLAGNCRGTACQRHRHRTGRPFISRSHQLGRGGEYQQPVEYLSQLGICWMGREYPQPDYTENDDGGIGSRLSLPKRWSAGRKFSRGVMPIGASAANRCILLQGMISYQRRKGKTNSPDLFNLQCEPSRSRDSLLPSDGCR